MATPNYDIDYNRKEFTDVTAEKNAALNESNTLYEGMVNNSDSYYNAQIDAVKDYEETQKANQQAQTDFAIDKIEQQKEWAQKDYLKEQSGAYKDWQKQSNQYGVNAEQMAAGGMTNTGFSESSQVAMYNQYQNRVATARESYQRAVVDYDMAIKDAQLKNSTVLAEIAYNSLQQRLTLSLEGFQYKNTLLLDKASKQREIDQIYHQRWQDVLNQINTENALAESVRQYDTTFEESKRHNEAIEKAQADQLQLERDKFTWQKEQAAKTAKITKSGGSGGGSYAKKLQKATGQPQAVKKPETAEEEVENYSAKEYINALIESGASKDTVANEIALARRNGAISKEEAKSLQIMFTPRGVQY